MSKSTISTFELFQMFPDAEAARVYMEGKRWPDGAVCPACDEAKRITTRKGGYYRCNACKTDFTVRTATIFERSHIPLHKWLYAMYLLVTARKGISSLQLAKQIGVTQKSAWFMLQRLREACGNDPIAPRTTGRIEDHRHTSKWHDMTATITLEWFETKAEALAAERNAVMTERPAFNKDHLPEELDGLTGQERKRELGRRRQQRKRDRDAAAKGVTIRKSSPERSRALIDLARHYGVHQMTIRRWIKSGKIADPRAESV